MSILWARDKDDVHGSEGSMDCSAPDLDGDDRVEASDSGLEGLQGRILVRKDAEVRDGVVNVRDAKSDAGGDVLLVGAEPGIALGLAEEPVEEGVVPVVVHEVKAGEGGQAKRTGQTDRC